MTNEFSKSEMNTVNNETLRQKFFTTEGRIGRMSYLKRNLLLIAMTFILVFVIEFFGIIANFPQSSIDIVIYGVMILLLIPNYCLDVKRLHDLGKDSTLAKIFLGISLFTTIYSLAFPALVEITPVDSLLSIVSLGFVFYLLLTRGEKDANQYGAAQ